jgi:hypothetical protein
MSYHQNIYNIGYRGASGGFLFLHFLLLSDRYYTDIFNNVDFSDAVEQQWNISNPENWKATEFWPENFKSINDDSGLDRIAYFCNPTIQDFFQKQKTLDIVAKCYDNVKDPSWPVLTSPADFVNLPTWIYDEIYQTLDCKNALCYLMGQANIKSVWLYTDINSQNELAYYKKAYIYRNQPSKEKIQDLDDRTEIWNGISVDKDAMYFLNNSDIQIKLQDLVNVPDSLIDCGLINNVNQKQYNLLKLWKSLHSPEILQKIGIK